MNELVTKDYKDIIAKFSLKGGDVETLRQLMTLQEEWEHRQAVTTFNEQMAQAQGEMSQISKDSANPQTRSYYASLAALDAAIRPIYTKFGFSVSFDEDISARRDDGMLLVAYVSNGAETRTFKKWIPVTTTGFKGGQMMTPTHASIAAVTYGRRALLKMIFNLAEEDDDGNLAGGKGNGEPQAERVDTRDYRARRDTSPRVDPADVDPMTGEIGRKA